MAQRLYCFTVSASAPKLLDLGCGTGLELDEIFKYLPQADVTGIDMTQEMLDKLKQKHPDKVMTLVYDDDQNVAFCEHLFDCALSFQILHHLSHREKLEIYRKVFCTKK